MNNLKKCINGENGDRGEKGDRGLIGYPGKRGFIGPKGSKGIIGNDGNQGLPGIFGIQGLRGELGLNGDIGITGEKGNKGYKGIKGIKGFRGVKGEIGDCLPEIGPKGSNGSIGDKGNKCEFIKNINKGNKGNKGERGLKGIESIWLTDFHFFSDYVGNSYIDGYEESIHIKDPLKYGFYSSPGGNKILNIFNKNIENKETNLIEKNLTYFKLEKKYYTENNYFIHAPTSVFSYNEGELDLLSYNLKQKINTGNIINTNNNKLYLWARIEIHCQNTSGRPGLNKLNEGSLYSPDYISWRTLTDFSEWIKIEKTSGVINLSDLKWTRGYDEQETITQISSGNLRNINKNDYYYIYNDAISNDNLKTLDINGLPEEYITYNYNNKIDLLKNELADDYIEIYNSVNEDKISNIDFLNIKENLSNNLESKILNKRFKSITNNKIYNGQSIAIIYCFRKPIRYSMYAVKKSNINISKNTLISQSSIEEHTIELFGNIIGDNGVDNSLLKTEFKFKEINFSLGVKVLK